tara:strand:+ start:3189 stop:3839 length:651 start_codon:yes stop_codon:yes gene_type:complete
MVVPITDEMKDFYIKKYKETYSVSEIMRQSNYGIGRRRIEKLLKEEGIYEGLSGKNYLKKKTEKIKEICQEKYGVDNYSHLKVSGWSEQNKHTYEKIDFLDKQYKQYHKEVNKLSKKNAKKIKDNQYCFYTGIQFADVEQDKVNPNDLRKRSIDHKIPVIICYLNNVSVEDASDIENIMYVLKYVNSIKGNTLHESFLSISPKIRKVFIDEGYKSN